MKVNPVINLRQSGDLPGSRQVSFREGGVKRLHRTTVFLKSNVNRGYAAMFVLKTFTIFTKSVRPNMNLANREIGFRYGGVRDSTERRFF